MFKKASVVIALTVALTLCVTGCGKQGQAATAQTPSVEQAIAGEVVSAVEESGQYDDEADFEFTISSDGGSVTITNYVGRKRNVRIPSQLQGLPVTIIGVMAFSNKGLTDVTIPNSVVTIEQRAFGWNQLTGVIIPNSVTTIGSYAFVRNRLANITIGANVGVWSTPTRYSFDCLFDEFYNAAGRTAGTYILQDNVWRDPYKPNMTAQDYNADGMFLYELQMWPEAEAMFYLSALTSFSSTPYALALYNLARVISIRLSESPPPEDSHSEMPGSQRLNDWEAFKFLWLSTQLEPNYMARAREDSNFENLRKKDSHFFDAITLPLYQLERHIISDLSFIDFFHYGTVLNVLRFIDANGEKREFCARRNVRWVSTFVYAGEWEQGSLEGVGKLKEGVAEKKFEIEYRHEASEFDNVWGIEKIINELRVEPCRIRRTAVVGAEIILSVREL
ncbi:MAG: leucine-rich repeat domain-containing protein [Chitinispirillales bacterium]|nr:leucine-rich repeat domain-containing protein [Chitinispirillales bacterium]